MRTELVESALSKALGRRMPADGLIHHSDRGSQYASASYRRLLADHGIVASMSRKADCWDNAVVESFFATLKEELVHLRAWPTHEQAHTAIADYIELFYNSNRLHSYLGYQSPAEFEKMHLARSLAA